MSALIQVSPILLLAAVFLIFAAVAEFACARNRNAWSLIAIAIVLAAIPLVLTRQ